MRRLKQIIEVGDERTLKTYLKYLEDGRIITCLSKQGKSLKRLEKPEKIDLNNPSQAFAICNNPNSGNLRELFFASMLQEAHGIAIPPKGDFIVDDQFIFEVGGKGKTYQQIKGLLDSFLALDDIENGFKAKIPLWMFGFLY